MEHETAGDPMSGLKWTRKTTEKIAEQLAHLNILVSPNTVARLLRGMGFSLRVNYKKLESGNKNPPLPEVRNQQFEYISQMREKFAKLGEPIISVDCKKKELIGSFKNNGTSWEEKPYQVNDHDFPNDANGKAVPYGIYDTVANFGFVVVGTSRETPAFVVDALDLWWKNCGSRFYPNARKILILADCGGGNSSRSRAWKYRLQHRFSNRYHLSVTICHYPPGASKWNPIEHRLFAEITKNWSGKPLESFETILKYLRTTTTSSGLQVRARLHKKVYYKGEKVPECEMQRLALSLHKTLPAWNYSLAPAKN